MRIVHFADLHIGVENYGRVDPSTGLSTRLSDFLDTYDEVVSYAIDNRADLVLFCGDAYRSRDPTQTHQREFARRIAKLSAEGIPAFLLVGNHDLPNVIGRATALDIFHTLDVANVYIGDRLDTYRIETAAGPIQIVAVPWVRRGAFLARDETRGLTPDQVNEAIQKSLARALRGRADSLDQGVPALFAGHLSVSDAVTSSEQSMMLGRDHVLLRSDVALPVFDYVALGHIHRHQILGHDPLVIYSGSLQRIDFGEENDEKGFCVIELDPSRAVGSRLKSFDFHRVDARSLLTISARINTGDPDPTATVVQRIASHHIEGAIVRLRITLPGELEGHLRDGDIRKALDTAHFVASISREVTDQPRVRLGSNYSQGLDPKEALRLYMESREIAADRAKVLMEHADGLMEESESGPE